MSRTRISPAAAALMLGLCLAACESTGIPDEAYSRRAQGEILGNERVAAVAESYGESSAFPVYSGK